MITLMFISPITTFLLWFSFSLCDIEEYRFWCLASAETIRTIEFAAISPFMYCFDCFHIKIFFYKFSIFNIYLQWNYSLFMHITREFEYEKQMFVNKQASYIWYWRFIRMRIVHLIPLTGKQKRLEIIG